MTPAPEAMFDVLAIVSRLGPRLDGATKVEIHLFCYLSCLLSLYRNRPIGAWAYHFFATETGTPFSTDIDQAIDDLVRNGHLHTHDKLIHITAKGTAEYKALSTLSQNTERLEYLDGASSSALALPVGAIRQALSQEPSLKRAAAVGALKALENGPLLTTVYEQFAALSESIGVSVTDLMIPSVVWLTYLAQAAKQAEE